jgi:hypothetical protein
MVEQALTRERNANAAVGRTLQTSGMFGAP